MARGCHGVHGNYNTWYCEVLQVAHRSIYCWRITRNQQRYASFLVKILVENCACLLLFGAGWTISKAEGTKLLALASWAAHRRMPKLSLALNLISASYIYSLDVSSIQLGSHIHLLVLQLNPRVTAQAVFVCVIATRSIPSLLWLDVSLTLTEGL